VADSWGIEHSFIDSKGELREVSPATIEGLRQALGNPSAGQGPLVILSGEKTDLGDGEVRLEDGTMIGAGEISSDSITPGYHTLIRPGGETKGLIASPGRCHLPEDLHGWGWASQLYGTRSRRSWGIGDLADLRRLGGWSRDIGASFVMISPIVAAAPTDRQEPNPYFPASRRFRNPLYLAVEDVPGAEQMAGSVSDAARAGHALNHDAVVDHDSVWKIKSEALQHIWDSTVTPDEFDRWVEDQPPSLRHFATWCVLTELHGPDWRQWPASLRRPDSDGVKAVAASERDRVRFFIWLQWCLSRQLSEAGSEIALIQDLPIGFDPGGFDAWEWQDLLALDVSIGAPPDPFNEAGQDWGAPPFIPWRLAGAKYQPFIESVRANLATGGGLRVDHVMGLWRLWCIPPGAGPAEGAYVRMPSRDLLAILALESSRARALVVGEDLGTVEPGVRDTLSKHDMLSYRLLWFEPISPERWPVDAMGAVTTHDLPTVAGIWDGSDVQAQREAGLAVSDDGNAEIKESLTAMTGLTGEEDVSQAVVAAYEELSRAPSRLLCATLEDVVCSPRRPNIPGASERHLNWRIALPVPLEDIESRPLAGRVSKTLARRRNREESND
jgi:4-alpha-glucanotransferase